MPKDRTSRSSNLVAWPAPSAASSKRSGVRIGPYDLLIAGQARARNLVLVTANSREFSRVEGLDSEDWSIAGAGQ